MPRLSALARLAFLLILTPSLACDNVEWGGLEVSVVPPPPGASPGGEAARSGDGDDDPEMSPLPEGPVVYYVRRQEGAATMVPVGEVSGDSLRGLNARNWELYGNRFIAEFLRRGTEFSLFRNGIRMGTFVAQSAEIPGPEVCPRLPRVTGSLELSPLADSVFEFLAMPKRQAPDAGRPDVSMAVSRNMQVSAPILAERLLRARRAQLPGNWQRAMVQLHPLPIAGRPDPGFTATFLVGDSLGPGSTSSTVAYSLFFVATPADPFGYDTVHVQFTDYTRSGKAAPRVIDFLDWDRDDNMELLLQVYGPRGSWMEAVGRAGGEWRRIFQNRCEEARTAQARGAAE